jgi:hypothetical protein
MKNQLGHALCIIHSESVEIGKPSRLMLLLSITQDKPDETATVSPTETAFGSFKSSRARICNVLSIQYME